MSIVFKSTLTIRSFVSLLALALLVCLVVYPPNTVEASSETTAPEETGNQLIAQTLNETPKNTADHNHFSINRHRRSSQSLLQATATYIGHKREII